MNEDLMRERRRCLRSLTRWRPLSGRWTWAYGTPPVIPIPCELVTEQLDAVLVYQPVEAVQSLDVIMRMLMFLTRSSTADLADFTMFDRPFNEGRWPPWRCCLKRSC